MENEESKGEQAEPQNACVVNTGVATVTLYLEGNGALAKALGSLELAKDLIKNYCREQAMREAALRARGQIIRPGLSN